MIIGLFWLLSAIYAVQILSFKECFVMLLAISGIHPIRFDDVNGTKVYGVVKDNQVSGVIGEPTASVWFDDEKACRLPNDAVVGSLVEIYFEQGKKSPAFCRMYDE